MSETEQAKALVTDIEKVIDRYRAEFDITLCTAIGALEIMKLHLYQTETES